MPTPHRTEAALRRAVSAVREHGSVSAAARVLGVNRATMQNHISAAREMWPDCLPPASCNRAGGWAATEKPFEVTSKLPSAAPTIEDLLDRRKREFDRVDAAKQARKLIDVAIRCDGPIGIAHFGDPHCDDPGTNIGLLEHHIEVVNRTEGLFAANLGDAQNNWIGRLARLHGEQSTSAAEAWVLVEWMLNSAQWIYLIGGNHDVWSGAGDPMRWIMRDKPGAFEANGVRLNLKFPNGRAVRVNARHDFKGFSMWNTTHGPSKAAQMGWRDHILTCGHLHISGYQIVKDPATGLLSHCIRVASYKTHDRYADELGLPDQNFSENVVTVIDPEASDERKLVTVFLDVDEAAEFLTWKRGRRVFVGKKAA